MSDPILSYSPQQIHAEAEQLATQGREKEDMAKRQKQLGQANTMKFIHSDDVIRHDRDWETSCSASACICWGL